MPAATSTTPARGEQAPPRKPLAWYLRPLPRFAAALLAIAAVLSLLFPHLRKAFALIFLGLSLAFIRQKYFAVPGVTSSGIPFGRAAKLLSGGGASVPRARRVKKE